MKKIIYLSIIAFTTLYSSSVAHCQNEKSMQEIKQVFDVFQDGYIKRDTSIVGHFVEQLFRDDILLIGTGNSEWIHGINDVKKIIKTDWKYWGNLRLYLDELEVKIHKNVAFFAVKAESIRPHKSKEEMYERYGVGDVEHILKKDISNKAKVIELLMNSAEILEKVEQLDESTFIFPVRLSGSLIKEKGNWKFNHITFSYPFPRRLIERKTSY